jgi:RNA polymerase sigma-70 factor (ECF subfamily)
VLGEGRANRDARRPREEDAYRPEGDRSDGETVRRVLLGDRDAFGILVRRYRDQMVAYVRYMGYGEAEAHDIVQDGFVRAFRHLRRCGDPDRFDGWLFRIVSNLCRSAGARRSKRAVESLDHHGRSLVDDGPGPEERAVAADVRARVRRALGRVPADQREALVLMYLQGYAVRDIARLTGASESAIKMRLKRGREALKLELAPVAFERGEG